MVYENLESKLNQLSKNINYVFKKKRFLIEALTHRSAGKHNNERLEFLGDAVVDLLVGEYLFKKFPSYKEGDLSKMRASLVNEESLAMLARDLNLGDFLILSQSEILNKGNEKNSLLADGFEAIIGAMYLDSGLKEAKNLLFNLLDKNYQNIEKDDLLSDYKTALQEITQSLFNEIPTYNIVKEIGPDHDKEFHIELLIQNKVYASALGSSKKAAQQAAAKIAYQMLKGKNG